MPFDAFMTAALAAELKQFILDLKVDKICQPERDEIDLLFRLRTRGRLVINCTASTPYMALSEESRENPPTPPMMCMLLRKHLSRAKITAVDQLGFDRIIRITFDSDDDLGFKKKKYLYCEMMGRGSNLIFADENQRILAAFRQNDITTKFDRIVMVGATYRPMPQQDKLDPLTCSEETFLSRFAEVPADGSMSLFLQNHFLGFGKLTAREIAYLATGDAENPVGSVDGKQAWKAFSDVMAAVRSCDFSPCLIYESKEAFMAEENPIDFSFMRIRQFPSAFYVHPCESISEAIESFYLKRNEKERQRQHYNDIAQILKNCRNRLEKKIDAQLQQLEDAKDADEIKTKGDLIIQEMYRVKKGDSVLEAMDYTSNSTVKVDLDSTLTPSQNAQRYYREYNKKKNALTMIQNQIDLAREELDYVQSVWVSLEHAVSAVDLTEIRQELSHWSYGRRLTSGLKKPQSKQMKSKPRSQTTDGGFTVYCGMNNFQNDAVSCHLAEKEDLWFHVKNYHGSHVLLKHQKDRPFTDADIEQAASLAAFYSEVGHSDKVEVDFTKAKFIKKPNGAKPGFITYKNHTSVLVKPVPFRK